MTTIERIPRPANSTITAQRYQANPTKNNKKKLTQLILKAFTQGRLYSIKEVTVRIWVKGKKPKAPDLTKNKKNKKEQKDPNQSKGSYCNRTSKTIEIISYEDLAYGLGWSIEKLNNRIMTQLSVNATNNYDQKLGQQNTYQAARATLERALNKSLQRYLTAEQWAEELKAVTRLQGYHPLHIKEANNASGQELAWLNTLHKFGTSLLPKGAPNGTNINIPIQVNQGTQPEAIDGTLLTTEMALKLLTEHGLANADNLDLNHIALKHGLNGPGFVDVGAIPSDAQGTKAFNPKDLKYIDHGDRRQQELSLPEDTEPESE